MTKSLIKDFQREIRKSISRFISILLIVALGVAFYSGVRSTMPAMHSTADAVYDKEDLMDIRIVGTLGLTQNDIEALKSVKGIRGIEGAFTTDFLCLVNTKEIVTRTISMPEKINDIQLAEGNFPEKYNECLASREFLEESGLEVGGIFTLSTGTDMPVSDTLVTDTFKIVGVCSSSYYLNGEVGTSNIGDGMGDGYVVIPKEAFSTNIYTSIYLTVAGAKELNCYSDEYEELINTVVKRIEEISEKQCDVRYTELRKEGSTALQKAQSEYAAASELIRNEITDAADKLAAQELLIEESRLEIEENKALLDNAEANLPIYQQKVAEAENAIAQAEAQISTVKQALESSKDDLNKAVVELELLKKDPNATAEEIQFATNAVNILQLAYTTAESEVAKGEKELEEAKKELLQAQLVVAQLQRALENKGVLIEAEQEIVTADKMIQQAREQYEQYKAEALARLEKAEDDLNEAERKVSEMEIPVWHVLDRQSIEAYMSYVTDSDSIGAIGTVFPMIFFLVAALVSLTTMTRMVEEERMQIGTLKAMGYSKLSIASKYLLYSVTASVIGSILGAVIGELTIPPIIISAYRAVYYNLGDNVLRLNFYYAVVAGVVATLCTTLAAFFACYRSLRSVPAELMRPVAPKAGKRTFIEGFTFIWQRLDFGQKSAVRNLFRYKKRFFMTLFGVGGCMALLIVGLGIRDSVAAMTENQYGEIFNYSGIVSVDASMTRAERRTMLSQIENIPGLEGYIQANRTMVTATSNVTTDFEDEKRAYLIVPTDVDQFPQFITLRERTGDKETVNLLSDGVIITEKYADLLGVEVNDNIYLKIDESTVTPKEVKVLGITENYIFNYIYMTPNLYQSLYNAEPDINILMIKSTGLLNDDNLKLVLTGIHGVNSVITNADEIEGLNEVVNNLDFIIILMVVSAAILAFVVLYNLNNINITERRRELATFRLLGFYNKELATYVYRENIVLTVLGIIVGIVMGLILHRFVMLTVETDVYMFGREIGGISVLIAVALTVVFSVAVNAIMYFNLKKIDMVESLKSVE